MMKHRNLFYLMIICGFGCSVLDPGTRRESLSDIEYERGNLDEALTKINKALEIEIDDRKLFKRCLIYSELHNYDLALKDIEFALKIDSTNTLYYDRKGLILTDIGSFSEAITQYKKATLIKSTYHSYYTMGITYLQLHDTLNAMRNFERSISLNSLHILSFLQLGKIYHRKGELERAQSLYSNAIENIKINKTDLKDDLVQGLLANRCTIYYKLGNNTDACNDFNLLTREYQSIVGESIKNLCL